MQRRLDEFRHALVVDRAWLARAQFIVQAIDAPFQEPSAPFAHCGTRELQPFGDLAVGLACSRRQDDARARHQRSRDSARTRHRSKLGLFVLAQHQFYLRSAHWHAGISRSVDTNILRKHRSVNNGTGH
ncbi:hypothetical protein D3C72_2149620 [compost metagenome]